MQDSASAHRARETVNILYQETPNFIPPDLWPPNSPDLNPVDYEIWALMQHRVYHSVDELKQRLIDVWCGLNSRLTTWLLTTGVEDFERASVLKEDTSKRVK